MSIKTYRLAEKKRKERERERREQYKAVQVHVKKDDGRMQAYGWSLPAKFNPPTPKDAPNKNLVPVPVPVYCRPLLEREAGMKVSLMIVIYTCDIKPPLTHSLTHY